VSNKPADGIERKRHYEAFLVYRDMGGGRTFRAVARATGASPQSISRWAEDYDWASRIKGHTKVVAKKKEAGALVKSDDPVVQKLITTMEQVEALINSAFTKHSDGSLAPKNDIKVKGVDELTKLVDAYRKYLETYAKTMNTLRPEANKKDRGTNIKEFNVNIGNVSQEERIAMMKELTNGNVSGGDPGASGGVQDADYSEVPERGDEDGP